MGRQIIVTALILVNGCVTHAAAVSRTKVGPLVQWLSETGKDRSDFDNDSAVLIGRKAGEAPSKARGAPGKGKGPDRTIHLFSDKSGEPEFMVVQRIDTEGSKGIETAFKITSRGKISKAWRMTYERSSEGTSDPNSGALKDLKVTKTERKLLDSEIDFWLARAKQDAQKQPAPAP